MKTRLDLLISKKFNLSRNKAQELIEAKMVLVNNKIITKNQTLIDEAIDNISIKEITKNISAETDLKNIDIYKKINIIFQHDDFIIIDKPTGISSHQAHSKDQSPNVADWFLSTNLFIEKYNLMDKRVGIVHRLDKETSGLMILARNYKSQQLFSSLFQERKIKKTYIAIVCGSAPKAKTITYNIVRNPMNPTEMTFTNGDGRDAYTEIKLINTFEKENKTYSLIECYPKTGRTHQIRVHMKAIGFPLLGDKTYGHRSHLIDRHALHASKIEFEYQNKNFIIQSNLPPEITKLI
jgi:23S rRNA pseudouridine1911/1915/1917 synthase